MRRVSFCLLVLVLFGTLFMSCEIGLGSAVDVAAPEVEITNPPVGAIIRDNFKINGTWSDDGTISNVSVTLVRTDKKGKPIDFTGEFSVIEEGNGTWEKEIITFDSSNSENKQVIIDGDYLATIKVTDGGKHTTTVTRQFTIDNTPPVIVLSSPSSKTISNPTSYGSVLNVSGKAADDSDVESMDFILYDETKTEVGRKTITSVSTQIDINIAEWGDELFKEVYGENKEAGTKNYYLGLEAYDGARKNPEVEGDRGNSTKIFYMNNDLVDLDGFKTSIAYNILNGTQPETGKYEGWKSALANNEIESAAISLNPVNNPYFDVQGYEPLGNTIDFNAENNPYEFMNKNKLTVNIYVGRDKTSINTETIGIYLKACSNDGIVYAEGSPNAKTVTLLAPYKDREGNLTGAADRTSEITSVGSTSYRWESAKLDAHELEGFDIGTNYIFDVVAYDLKGIGIKNDNKFGIKVTTTSSAPSISIEKLNGDRTGSSLSIGNSAAFYVIGHISASSEIQSLKAYVNSAADPITGLNYEVSAGSSFEAKTQAQIDSLVTAASKSNWLYKNSEKSSEQSPYYNFCFVIPSGACTDSSFNINIVTKDLMGQEQKKEIEVNNDTEAPVFGDFTVTPYVDVTESGSIVQKVNGVVTIKQLVSDNNSIKNTWYSVDNGSNWFEVGKTTSMNFSVDTTAFDDNTPKTIYLKAEDAAGNIKILSSDNAATGEKALVLNVAQSTDAPEISFSNVVQTAVDAADLSAISLFGTTANNYILGAITDDDGIASVTVKYSANESSWSDLTVENSASLTNKPTTFNLKAKVPATEGKYQIKLTVVDKEGKTSYATKNINPFLIAVDDGAPELVIKTASGADQFKASTFEINGTLNDKNATLKAYTDNGCTTSAGSDVTVTLGDWDTENCRYNWKAIINGGNDAKTKTYFFQAKDEFGQSTTKEYKFSVDPKAPVFEITNLQGDATSDYGYTKPADGYVSTNKFGSKDVYFTVKGQAKDVQSGSEKISGVNGRYFYYYVGSSEPAITNNHYTPAIIEDGEFKTQSGWNTCSIKQTSVNGSDVFTWEAPISFAAFSDGDDLTIYFAVMDNAGNYSTVADNPSSVLKIKVDGKIPEISGTPKLTLGTNTTIETIARDGESSVGSVSVLRNGVSYTLANTYTKSGDVDASGSDWVDGTSTGNKFNKYTQKITSADLVAGENKFIVVVTDAAGNTKKSSELTINNDAPLIETRNTGIESTAKDDSEFTYVKDAFTSTAKVTCGNGTTNKLGTISWKDTYMNGTTETDLNSGTVTPDSNNEISITSPTTSTEKTISDYENKQVTRTVTATNLFGQSTTWSYKFRFDVTKPVIDSNDKVNKLAGSTVSKAWFNSNTISIEGSYTEAGSGINKITYILKDGTGTYVENDGSIFTTPSSGKETYNTNIAGFKEGTTANVLTLVANDKAGNPSDQKSYSIRIDNTDPRVSAETKPDAAQGDTTTSEIWYRFKKETEDSQEDSWKKFDSFILTNLKKDIEVTGAYLDQNETNTSYIQSGVNSIKISVNGKTITAQNYSYANDKWTTNDFASDDSGNYLTDGRWFATVEKSDLEGVNGTCSAKVTVIDGAGNKDDSYSFAFKVDTAKPSITLTEPSVSKASSGMNGNITISGTVTDGLSSSTGVDGNLEYIKLYYSIADQDDDNTTAPATATDWYQIDATKDSKTCSSSRETFDITHRFSAQGKLLKVDNSVLKLTDKETTDSTVQYVWIKVEAKDISGWTNTVTRKIKVDRDTDRPVITINNIGLGRMTSEQSIGFEDNKIYGLITDDDGIADDVAASGDNPAVNAVEYSLNNGTSWTKINHSSGSFNITLPDGSQTILFKVIDKEGGVYTTSTSTTYNENAPKLVDKDSNQFGYNNSKATAVYLTIDTQNPAADSLEYKYTASGSADWSTAISSQRFGGDAAHGKIKFRQIAGDINGIEKVTIEIPAATGDKSGAKYKYEVTQGTNESNPRADGVTYTVFETEEVDLSGFVSGSRQMTVTVFDGIRSSVNKVSILIDNDAPRIHVDSHADEEQIRSSFLLKGTIDDGDVGTKVELLPTASASIPDDWSSAKVLNGTTAMTWRAYFDGLSDDDYTHFENQKDLFVNLYGTAEKIEKNSDGAIVYKEVVGTHRKGEKYRTIQKVYFHFRVTDSIGNVNDTGLWTLKIDPQGDIPVITQLSPSATETTQSGTIRFSGSAEDDKTITGLYMEIDPQYNGSTFTAWSDSHKSPNDKAPSGVYTVKANNAEGIKAGDYVTNFNKETTVAKQRSGLYIGNSLSWNIAINKSGELNGKTIKNTEGIDETPNNTVAVRFYAIDVDGNISDPTEPFVFEVDSDAPKIGSKVPFYLYQYDDDGTTPKASMEYTEGMWLKGNWFLVGSVEDESGIKTLTVGNENITSSSTTVNKNGKYNNGETWTTTSGYVTKIPVGNSEAGKAGTLTYTLSATDNDDKPASKVFTIKYDNKAPVLSPTDGEFYKINRTVQNSDGFYTIKSSVEEADSGFERVVFYFKRTISDYHYVYDSYLAKENSELSYDGASPDVTQDETTGLYWTESSIATNGINGSTVTITAANSNAHPGGIARIGETIYRVKNVSGVTITLEGNPSTEFGKIYFAIGHVVDHSGAESTGTKNHKENGYYTDSPDDDDDRMIESVSTTGNRTIWSGSINSQNIPDGDIELHYVAFDKAGNYSRGIVTNNSETSNEDYSVVDYDASKKIAVANNAPRLAGVRIWTDYNNNGTEDQGESESMFKRGRTFSIKDSSNNINQEQRAREVTDTLIVSGNGYDFNDSTSGSTYMTIRNKTKFYPELVGGNNALYYSYNIGTEDQFKAGSGYRISGYEAVPATGKTSVLGSGRYDGEDITKDDEEETTFVDSYETSAGIEFNAFASAKNANETGKINSNGKYWFEYTIWDSTEGCTTWNAAAGGTAGRLNATMRIALDVQYFDDTKPTVVVNPLYWKSATDNSVYMDVNGKLFGHVELKDDLGSSTLGTTYGTDDDKVSGIVVFRGYAYDNKRLKKLDWKITNSSGTSILTGEGVTFSSGSWSTGGELSDGKPYKFTVIKDVDTAKGITANDVYFSGKGHKVMWELAVNTSYITGIVAKDAKLVITATDDSSSTGLTNNTAETATGADGVKNVPSYQVDILPYITGITTRLARKDSANPTIYSRTAKGHYPIASDEGTVTLKGYNLDAKSADVIIPATTVAGWSTGAYEYTVSGTIKTINNINNNDAHGIYNIDAQGLAESTKVTNMYNRTPNTTTNLNLTDDVYFDVWELNSNAATSGSALKYPVMHINPSNGQIGFGFVKGADSVSFPANGYSYLHYQKNRKDYIGTNFVFDSNGVAHNVSIGLDGQFDSGIAGRMLYNNSNWYAGNDGPNRIAQWDKRYSIALESVGIPNGIYIKNQQVNVTGGQGILDTDRFTTPAIAASAHTDGTAVYIMYYDSDHDQIRFRYGEVPKSELTKTGTNGTWINNNKNNNTIRYRDITNDGRAKTVREKQTYNDNKWGESQFSISELYNYGLLNDGKSERQRHANKVNTEGIGVDYSSTTNDTTIYHDGHNQNDLWSSHAMFEASKDYYALVTGDYYYQSNDGKNGTAGTLCNSTGNQGSEYYAMSVVPGNSMNNDKVVMVWYDNAAKKLMYMYRYNLGTNATASNTDASSSGVANEWSVPKEIYSTPVQNVAMTVDGLNGIHIAAYDQNNADLVYIYIPTYNYLDTEGNKPYTCTVDGYSQIGSMLTIDTALDAAGTKAIPYISYYAEGLSSLPKVAFLPGGVNSTTAGTAIKGGVNSTNQYSGVWEVSMVPTDSALQKYNVNVGLFKTNGILDSKKTGGNDDANQNHRKLYGNGKSHLVLGYAIRSGGVGYIETAMYKEVPSY